MNQSRTVFWQLISFLPDREFRRCVEHYQGDIRLRGFSCWDQYLVLAFAQLTYRESLRDIEACQIIRLRFDQPQQLKHIWLVFEETEAQRTQEFVLRWSPDHGRSFREIVRQQWNFSPPETIRETEEYDVDLRDVTVLELRILPDQGGGAARASLASLRVA